MFWVWQVASSSEHSGLNIMFVEFCHNQVSFVCFFLQTSVENILYVDIRCSLGRQKRRHKMPSICMRSTEISSMMPFRRQCVKSKKNMRWLEWTMRAKKKNTIGKRQESTKGKKSIGRQLRGDVIFVVSKWTL